MNVERLEQVARESLSLAGQLGRLLAGRGGHVQGAALADLVATWLSGHVGTPAQIDRLFARWSKMVRQLEAAARAEREEES